MTDKTFALPMATKVCARTAISIGVLDSVAGTELPVLFLHNSVTGLMGAISTLQTGGKFLNYLATEASRFTTQTGHREVGLGCDDESSTLTLMNAVKKTCQASGIKTHAEPAPVGDHAANGGAEVTVHVLRSHEHLSVPVGASMRATHSPTPPPHLRLGFATQCVGSQSFQGKRRLIHKLHANISKRCPKCTQHHQ